MELWYVVFILRCPAAITVITIPGDISVHVQGVAVFGVDVLCIIENL